MKFININYIVVYISLLVIVLHSATAEETRLSISDSIERALESNLDIQLEKLTLDYLKWENTWTWTNVFPTVTGYADLSRRNTEPKAPSPTQEATSQWGLNGTFSVSSPLGPLLAQKIIEIFGVNYNFQKGEITYEKAIKSIVLEVQKSYFDLLISQQEIAILEEQLKVIVDQNKDLLRSYRSGLIDEYTYLQSEIQKLQLEQKINAKHNSISSLLNTFTILIGSKENETFYLTEEVPNIEIKHVQNLLDTIDIENNYEYRIGQINNVVLNITQYAALLGLFPTFSLNWRSSKSFTEDPLNDDWYSDANWTDDNGALSFRLSLSISNLFPGSKAFSQYISAQKNYKSHVIKMNQTHDKIQQTLMNLKNTLRLNIQSLEILLTQRKLARKAFEIMQEKYNNGLAKYTEYQTAENNLLESEQKYLFQKITTLKTILDINFLLGENNEFQFNN